MLDINRHWYRPSLTWLTRLLWPLSGIYGLVVSVRHLLYRWGFKKTVMLSVPVMIVGNITVGGTGKTPFVIWLADVLRKQGLRPGIISRGYGGLAQQCVSVTVTSDPRQVGDEAVLLARRAQCPVVVGVNRVAAAHQLLATTDCNIVISDDGLQHYRLQRQCEIVMVDGKRGFGNQQWLPAGPLRESIQRLQKADFVITQQDVSQDFTMQLAGDEIVALTDAARKKPLRDLAMTRVHAVAAIGNPERFFAALERAGLTVIPHAFPDHYPFSAPDLAFHDALPIVMTEKDAVKCQAFAQENMWYLPVTARLDATFHAQLLKTIHAITS